MMKGFKTLKFHSLWVKRKISRRNNLLQTCLLTQIKLTKAYPCLSRVSMIMLKKMEIRLRKRKRKKRRKLKNLKTAKSQRRKKINLNKNSFNSTFLMDKGIKTKKRRKTPNQKMYQNRNRKPMLIFQLWTTLESREPCYKHLGICTVCAHVVLLVK